MPALIPPKKQQMRHMYTTKKINQLWGRIELLIVPGSDVLWGLEVYGV